MNLNFVSFDLKNKYCFIINIIQKFYFIDLKLLKFFRNNSTNVIGVFKLESHLLHWHVNESFLGANPDIYSDMFIPVSLKASKGGLWIRASTSAFAKHSMYENQDAIRFFKHRDAIKDIIWEPTISYGIHVFDRRTLLERGNILLLNEMFKGAKYTYGVSDKIALIGAVNHYERFVKFLSGYPLNTYIRQSFVFIIKYNFVKIFFKLVGFIFNKIINFFSILYSRFYSLYVFSQYFLGGIRKSIYDLLNYNLDSEFFSYSKFIEFYKLPGYLF